MGRMNPPHPTAWPGPRRAFLGGALAHLGAVILCLLGLVAMPAAMAETGVLVLDGHLARHRLEPHLWVAVDDSGRLDAAALASNDAALAWRPLRRGERFQVADGSVLWLRFDVQLRTTEARWELELARSGTDRISVYHQTADGSWAAQHAGDRLPVSAWTSPDRFPVFSLDADPYRTIRYWVRVEHARVPFSGSWWVRDHRDLREQRIQEQFLLGAYFGMALLLVVVASANAVVFRDPSFAAYAIYISLLGLSLAASLGVGGQFLWPDSARWNQASQFCLLPLVGIAGLLFLRQVIQPRRVGRTLSGLTTLVCLVWLLVVAWDVTAPSDASLHASTALGAVTIGLGLAMTLRAWQAGDRWARWVALGVCPVLLGSLIPVLRNFNLLESDFLSQYGMVIAAAIEAPVLIYALLQRSSLQHEAQVRARALTLTEPLTGLTYRHHFLQRLHESLVRSQRHGHQSALLLVHLDNHDHLQNRHGREVADRALVLAASLLRSEARDIDTAARVGDTTLAWLMEGPIRSPQALAAATGLVASGLKEHRPLPSGASLQLRIVVAMLPDASGEFGTDAKAHLDWLTQGLLALAEDPRKAILRLNF